MLIMKKVLLTAVAALALVATSFAQNAPAAKVKVKPSMTAPAQGAPTAPATQGTPAPAEQGKGMGHGKGKGHSEGEARGEGQGKGQGGLKALGLTPEQETQFKSVNEAHKAAVKAVQMDANLAADAKKAQVEALKSKYESNVQGVLNADQFAKWTAMRAKRADKKDDDRKEDGDHKGGDHKKGGHKADGAGPAAPADGSAPTAVPAAAEKMKMKAKKGH
jgi:periplasmic protein CpxP/Spy